MGPGHRGGDTVSVVGLEQGPSVQQVESHRVWAPGVTGSYGCRSAYAERESGLSRRRAELFGG